LKRGTKLAAAPVLERNEDQDVARTGIRKRQAPVVEHELRRACDIADGHVMAVDLIVDDILPLIGGDTDWQAHTAGSARRTRDDAACDSHRDPHHATAIGAGAGRLRQRSAMDELGRIVLPAAREIVDDSLASADRNARAIGHQLVRRDAFLRRVLLATANIKRSERIAGLAAGGSEDKTQRGDNGRHSANGHFGHHELHFPHAKLAFYTNADAKMRRGECGF